MTKPKWTPVIIRLGDIIPWDENPRMSNKAQAKRLIESEREFGQPMAFAVSPADEQGRVKLYDGHQRFGAWLTQYGEDYKMDARQSDRYLTDDERIKFVFTMHAGAVGQWNWDKVASFPEARAFGFDADYLKTLNNDANNLKEFLRSEEDITDAEPQIDRAAELLEKWQVVSGDMFQIGEHRLICGDCTDAAVVARVMGGERARLCFTSPPYADAREYSGNDLSIETVSLFFSSLDTYVDLFVVNLGILREGNEVICYWDKYIEAAHNQGLKFLSWNVWNREDPYSMAQQTAMFPIEHEFIFVFGRNRVEINKTVPNKHAGENTGTSNRQTDGMLSKAQQKTISTHRRFGTVFTGRPHTSRDMGHPAMFPVALPEAYTEACTNPGEIVSEPFCGSGTTIVACQNLGRRGRGIEISPAYVAVSL